MRRKMTLKKMLQRSYWIKWERAPVKVVPMKAKSVAMRKMKKMMMKRKRKKSSLL